MTNLSKYPPPLLGSSSGGPVIILGAAGENVQVGVTSFGAGGTGVDPTDFPDVPARVSNGFDWIKNTICQEIPTDTKFCLTPAPTFRPTRKANKTKPIKTKASNLFV